jgi:hypothetical protein
MGLGRCWFCVLIDELVLLGLPVLLQAISLTTTLWLPTGAAEEGGLVEPQGVDRAPEAVHEYATALNMAYLQPQEVGGSDHMLNGAKCWEKRKHLIIGVVIGVPARMMLQEKHRKRWFEPATQSSSEGRIVIESLA